jgi:hypothetical protein
MPNWHLEAITPQDLAKSSSLTAQRINGHRPVSKVGFSLAG